MLRGFFYPEISFENRSRLWDPISGSLLKTLFGHKDIIWAVAFSSDGKLLASGSQDTTVRIWEVNSGRLLHVLNGHKAGVRTVAFNPTTGMLASGSGLCDYYTMRDAYDEVIRIWDPRLGTLLRRR